MIKDIRLDKVKCHHCGGKMYWDDDYLDAGLFCLNCGRRDRVTSAAESTPAPEDEVPVSVSAPRTGR